MSSYHLNVRQLGGQAALNDRSTKQFLDTSLVAWLRASDVKYTSVWNDHRGAGPDATTCAGLDQSDEERLFDDGDNSYCQIPAHISPFNMPQATMSVCLKHNSIANTREWLLTHNDGGCDRSLLMHDTWWGADSDGNGYTGLGSL